MSEDDILSIEQELNLKLPLYYVDFMLRLTEEDSNNFGDFELLQDCYDLTLNNVEAYNDLWYKPMSRDYFVIGQNGMGDYFVIDRTKDIGVIAFSHEDQRCYLLANSLPQYLEKLRNETFEENWDNPAFLVPDIRTAKPDKKDDPSFFERFAIFRKIFG